MTIMVNGAHVEWQSLDCFTATLNSAQLSIVSTPLPPNANYTRVLKFTGHASPGEVDYPLYNAPVNKGPTGTRQLFCIYLRWTDITPGTEHRFLTFKHTPFGVGELYFILETDGDIRVMDDNDATIATITSPLTVNTQHRFEINYVCHGSAGAVRVWLDGSEILIDQTGLALGGTSLMDHVQIRGPLADGGDMFYAGSINFTDIADVNERFNNEFEFIGPYQAPDATTATPDTGVGDVAGDNLDSSTQWSHSSELPPGDTNVSIYDGTTAKDGGIFLDSGARSGPSGDSRIDGDSNIIGSLSLFRAKRGFGGATTYALIAGNKTNQYDAAERYAPIVQAAYGPFFVCSEAAGAVPLSTEFGLLGFEANGERLLTVADMVMFLLHVPSAGGITIAMDLGSLTFSGKDPDIIRDLLINMDTGGLTFAGLDPVIQRDVPIPMNLASFTFAGLDPTIARDVPFLADLAIFSLSGKDHTITRQLLFNANLGTFTFAGLDPILLKTIPILLDLASFTFAGLDPTFTRQLLINMNTGVFTFAGLDMTFVTELVISMDTGSFTFTGRDLTLLRDLLINMDTGAFTFTGLDPIITRQIPILMNLATAVLSGHDANITRSLLVLMDAGVFTLAGLDLIIVSELDSFRISFIGASQNKMELLASRNAMVLIPAEESEVTE